MGFLCQHFGLSFLFKHWLPPHRFVALALCGTWRSPIVVDTALPQKELFLWEVFWSRLSFQLFCGLTFSLYCIGYFQKVGRAFRGSAELQMHPWLKRKNVEPRERSETLMMVAYIPLCLHIVSRYQTQTTFVSEDSDKNVYLVWLSYLTSLSLPNRADVWLHPSSWETLSSCLSVLILPSHSRLLSSDTCLLKEAGTVTGSNLESL